MQEVLSAYDFVVIKSGDKQGIFYSFEKKQKLQDALNKSLDFARLSKEISLPDNSVAIFYKRKYIRP